MNPSRRPDRRRPRGFGALSASRSGIALLGIVSTVQFGAIPAVLSGQTVVDFVPPEPERRVVEGVPVYLIQDNTLPLVTFYARLEGGYARFGRENYASGMALPALLRYGGVAGAPPDSIDRLIEHYALQTTFGGGGGAITSSVNTLSEYLNEAVELWGAMLADPGLDSTEVEIWRGRQLEQVRRRTDDPGTLAVSRFNRMIYGDHPIGWELTAADLSSDRLSRASVLEIARRVMCRDNLSLGVVGDVDWNTLRPLANTLVRRFEACADSVPPTPRPQVNRDAGVFVLHRAEAAQSVLILAHTTDVRLSDDSDYYSASIGNSVLGAGGFSSRLMSRLRSERGYAYSVSSLWTTPRDYEGLLGATTRTSPETAAAAARLIVETMNGLRLEPPTEMEVRTASDAIVNGFVFSFENPGQIISRTMFYEAQDLPSDWLSRYVRGVQRVTPETVHRAFLRHLRPGEMTTLVVGDTTRMDMAAFADLGPVTFLDAGEEGESSGSR
ncbi:MAG: insulinase family protein [Gemmatimonadetes bacterium]|nr:insulinase family protein [Gemmatimonadota bacterium]